MRPDDTPDEFSEGAYVVRQTWSGNLPVLALFGLMDAFLLYQAIRNPGAAIVVVLAGFGGVTAILAVLLIGPIRRREVSFAVDARGVYFGPSDPGDQPELIPWSWIACVVTFDRIVRSNGQKSRHLYAGVELTDAGVAARMSRLPRPPGLPPPTAEERDFNEAVLMPWLKHMVGEPSLVSQRIQGWRLNMARLTEAVQRYALGTPVVHRPTRSDPGIAGIAFTAWQVHKNFRRLSERDERQDDD
ncbi:hypothetical protein [Actinomadura livida]|uniref:Uncharacterized protein n=1 Tax=Actinomadura livida TaxID=79909 RepID=A0A7W7II41_9ACTN|nr:MULTISPECIES: hypothetical protein [Actinomadura]MBB4777519.1 hypothetical protein [Actinomadura catellatispora]GGU00585.1 hypothetical protein GCM10010208_25580 [Actinomadura livida]